MWNLTRSLSGALLALTVVLLGAGPAAAHGVSDTADVEFAQSFDGNELTFVVRRAPEVPGPLRVDVIAHQPVRPVTIELAARPLEGGAPAASERNASTVRLEKGRPGTYSTALRVDGTGRWELTVQVGDERSVLPFRVMTPRPAAWEATLYPALAATGVLIVGTLVAAVRRRRVLSVALAAATAVTLVVATTAASLSPFVPAALPKGAAPTVANDPAQGFSANGRPFANAVITTEPSKPVSGRTFVVRMRLLDGSTGQPVNDLMVHHGALAHTVVTSKDLSFFRHVHPVLTGSGTLEIRLTVDRPGRYLAQTEFERADSGGQQVSGSFQVGGSKLRTPRDEAGAPAAPAADGERAHVTVSPSRVVAGEPTAFDLRVDTDAGPARDLQPWLGMAGHMFVRDRRSDFFAHIHELDSMAEMSVPNAVPRDETVGRYGPVLRFTYSFPGPGRYVVWLQYSRNFTVHTTRLTIDVAAEGN
ncbi:hypothetical protein [Streptomyces sp. NPDC047525]|uniref:hypothetical protein n=1 Tax=Streptomyces sp. NPDC047525 TaxID=3155264 RepID=UPI003404FD17